MAIGVNLEYPAFNESNTYAAYDANNVYKCTVDNIMQIINEINIKKSNERVLIEIENTVGLTDEIIKSIPDNVDVRVIGGLTEEYARSHKNQYMDYLREKATYSRDELQQINNKFKEIESKIDPKWNDYDKALYLYEYMKYNIVYRKGLDGFGNMSRTRTWDTLIGLINELSTCSGFAHIYQELCTRQNIKCVKTGGTCIRELSGDHAWNVVEIDGKNFIVDIIWDAQEYEKGKDVTTGFAPKEVSGYHPKAYREMHQNLSSISPEWVESTSKKVSQNIPKEQKTKERLEHFFATRKADWNRMMQLRGEQIKNDNNMGGMSL